MPINVFGNSSSNSENRIDTSLFVQKPYLRSNYVDGKIEGDVNMKNQYIIKNLPCPQENTDTVCKFYVDNLSNDSSILKETEFIDLNDRNFTNARFFRLIIGLK